MFYIRLVDGMYPNWRNLNNRWSIAVAQVGSFIELSKFIKIAGRIKINISINFANEIYIIIS